MGEQRQRVRVGSDALQDLVETLAARLRRAVVVDDPLVRLVCSSQHFGDEDAVRIRSLLQGRAPDDAIRHVLDQGVTRWPGPGFIAGRDDLGLRTRYCAPLRERGHLVGLLMVVAPDGTLTEEETTAIGQALPAITAQMYADQLAATAQEAALQECLLDLLDPHPAVRASARQRVLNGGLLPDTAHAVVSVVQLAPAAEPPGQTEVALRGGLEQYGRTRSATAISAVTPEGAILLELHPRPVGERDLAEHSAALLKTLTTYVDPAAAPVVGTGGVQQGLAAAWISHGQALTAARAARRVPRLDGVGVWDALGEYAVLMQVPDEALGAPLLPRPLRDLLESPVGRRLEDTLRCFLEHAGSVPRTAQALGVHRTSLYYRLRQIQEITGVDLDDGGDRLTLHLGLRIRDLVVLDASTE